MYIHTIHVHICVYVGVRVMSAILLDHSTLFFEAESLTQTQGLLMLTVLLASLFWGIHLCFLRLKSQVDYHVQLTFTWVSGALDSGPQAYTGSTLTPNASPQLQDYHSSITE